MSSLLKNIVGNAARSTENAPRSVATSIEVAAGRARLSLVLNAEQAVDRAAAIQSSDTVTHLTHVVSRDIYFNGQPVDSINQAPDSKFVEVVPDAAPQLDNPLSIAGQAVAEAFGDTRARDAA